MTRKQSKTEYPFWETVEEKPITIWVNFKDNVPVFLKILDWNPKTWEYKNKSWGKTLYLETNKGYLRISSKRLQRALKPYVGSKNWLKITRKSVGDTTFDYIYQVEEIPLGTSIPEN